MDQIRPFQPTDFIDQADEEEAIRIIPAPELKKWVVANFLTLGGPLHNPDHDHIAELIDDNEEFLAFAWASSAYKSKQAMLVMRDAVAGEEQIKQAQTKYLPKSAGMIKAEKQGDTTGEIYKAYLSRAQYPLWVQDSLRTLIGLVSKLEPNIVIESSLLKSLIENATNDGFGLKQLFIRICLELLEYGRCGLLVDVDAKGVPYFALYDALSIIN